MRIAVVGGGMTGLVAAERLGRSGRRVIVFDNAEQLGGLSTWHDYGGFVWDKFYHVILPTDRLMVDFLRRLGLAGSLVWRQSRTGYFEGGRHFSLSNNIDFLKFPLLNPFQKARLAWTILYGSRISDWHNLENLTSEDWLIKHSGLATYEAFWKPLMVAKLGDSHREVSAVFIWSYIKRLFSAREPSAGKEQLGYVRGGYRTILERLAERIEECGEIRLRHTVERIRGAGDGRLSLSVNGVEEEFDRVIFTGPVGAARRVCPADLIQVERDSAEVRYLGVICLVLVTRVELTPYYVINIADREVPFTGVIGMSSLVPSDETDNKYITYFPKYLESSRPLFECHDDEILADWMPAVDRLFPFLKRGDIVSHTINRARNVQPLQVLGYSRIAPRAVTRHPGLFLLNTGQFKNNTVHNNEVLKTVEEFFEANDGSFDD